MERGGTNPLIWFCSSVCLLDFELCRRPGGFAGCGARDFWDMEGDGVFLGVGSSPGVSSRKDSAKIAKSAIVWLWYIT